jgi:hypothetical protein
MLKTVSGTALSPGIRAWLIVWRRDPPALFHGMGRGGGTNGLHTDAASLRRAAVFSLPPLQRLALCSPEDGMPGHMPTAS